MFECGVPNGVWHCKPKCGVANWLECLPNFVTLRENKISSPKALSRAKMDLANALDHTVNHGVILRKFSETKTFLPKSMTNLEDLTVQLRNHTNKPK
jgi:hypothetical protein